MKQLRRDNTGAGPRRCRSPPIVTTVVEGERRSPGSSSWRSSIRELPSLSQAGTGSRTMAPRGWRQRRKALWSGEAIVRNFEARENPTALQNQGVHGARIPCTRAQRGDRARVCSDKGRTAPTSKTVFAVVRRFLAKPLPRRTKKSKKTDKCIVSGYRPKAGVVDQGTTNLVCRQHEFGMGHLRDPAACYLDSTLSEYRRLRPRQKRFLFFSAYLHTIFL